MISGNDDSICRVLAKLNLEDDLGNNRDQTVKLCENAYKEAEREILEMRFLRPFMTADDYEKALLEKRVNRVIKSIAEEIRRDREESSEPTFSCGLLLCGFDQKKKPYLLSLSAPGVCTDATINGFAATGSGSAYALQRLLSNEWQRKYTIDRALFEILMLKFRPKMI